MDKATIDTFLNNWEDFEELLVKAAQSRLDERWGPLDNALEIRWHFIGVYAVTHTLAKDAKGNRTPSKDTHNLTLEFRGMLKDSPAFSGPCMVIVPFAEIEALATPDNGGK